jgi:DsbC/DsbD-like thiol-disulfide interchange protein
MRYFLPLLLLAITAGCSGTDEEQARPAGQAPPLVVLSHAFSHTAAVPGQTLRILWQFDLADSWHLYGPGRNDSGFPPSVKLTLPAGWQAGPLQWPAPARYLMPGGILDHVYHGQLLLVQDLVVPASAKVGQAVVIPAQVDWLVCKDECVPGRTRVELRLQTAATAGETPRIREIAAALQAVPGPAPDRSVTVAWTEGRVALEVAGATGLEFYPDLDCLPLLDLAGEGQVQGSRLELGVGPPRGDRTRLKGILHQVIPGAPPRNWTIDFNPGG